MEELLLQSFYNGTAAMPFVIAFVAGALSFLSPCILPLVPAYMSYISGVSLEQLDSSHIAQGGQSLRLKIFWRSCLFVLGFSLVFIGLGLALSSVITLMQSRVVNIVAGLIVLGFGIHFLGIWRLNFLYKTLHVDLKLTWRARIVEIFAPFVLGLSFALGYTPCTGAIFGAITLVVGTTDYGVVLLLLYACGLALPFLLVALLLERGFRLLARLKRFMRTIEIISGVVLIIMGVLIMAGSVDLLSQWWSALIWG